MILVTLNFWKILDAESPDQLREVASSEEIGDILQQIGWRHTVTVSELTTVLLYIQIKGTARSLTFKPHFLIYCQKKPFYVFVFTIPV